MLSRGGGERVRGEGVGDDYCERGWEGQGVGVEFGVEREAEEGVGKA